MFEDIDFEKCKSLIGKKNIFFSGFNCNEFKISRFIEIEKVPSGGFFRNNLEYVDLLYEDNLRTTNACKVDFDNWISQKLLWFIR